MTSEEVRLKFVDFFREHGHHLVPSSSLIPADPSVLFTTAGMQQFKKYYTGGADAQKDFKSLNVISIQKCFRTSDMDEVGDETHNTFFEMLGNFSFAGYGKKEAIQYAHEFVTKILGLSIDYVSVFQGEGEIPEDSESEEVWRSIDPDIEIKKFGKLDNFWGPTGKEGPCGPTTEIYVDGVEIWNLVFNEYYEYPDGRLTKLTTLGVDTGMGMERTLAVLGGVGDVFETDVLKPVADKVRELAPNLDKRALRILTDHLRASVFLIADSVRPSNKETGYVLRRLLRRIIAYQIKYDIHPDLFVETLPVIIRKFGGIYSNLRNQEEIRSVWQNERGKFELALGRGLKALRQYRTITAKEAFNLYQSYGLPFEVIKEVASPQAVQDLKEKDFEVEFQKHQEISRAGAEKKFGGHGLILDTGELKAKDEEELEKVTRLHTATHLLQAALRQVLGEEVEQMGSDINARRTRFDFSSSRKLTEEEIRQTERLVNEAILKNLAVNFVELPLEKAKETGALYSPLERYPERVKVYYVGESLDKAFSKELCGGPHVKRTAEVGQFKIFKEEGVSSGVRRLRATVI